MATSSSVRQAKQDLAHRLKDIRVAAGLTATALAEAAGWHRTKVSKLENLSTSFSAEDIRTWCQVCGVPAQAEDLVAALLAADTMWTEWKRMERAGLKRAQESVLPLWESTRRFRIYSPWLVPGPVQHESYVRALLTATKERRGLADDIEAATAARVAKQHVAYEGDHRFSILLEENVLRHRIGGMGVLRDQLLHLFECTRLPSVSLGVIPLTADRFALRPVEMFFIFDELQVNVELVSGWLRVTAPSELALYGETFERLRSMAVFGEPARTLISDALAALGG